MSRIDDLVRFYSLVDSLSKRVGGPRVLADLGRFRDWPNRGVYLFFEPFEMRSDSGKGPRIVRVGTHALAEGRGTTLRQRLGQHRGLKSGGGNHRGSIFRLLVGQALSARRDIAQCRSWGVAGTAAKASAALGISPEALADAEAPVERAVTNYIGTMPFLWLDIGDEPGAASLRGFVERNAIALLSNQGQPALDPPSSNWLGRFSDRPLVRASGVWNQRHVVETHDPRFLDAFDAVVAQTGAAIDRVS